MVLNTEWAQVEVIDLFNDGTGLAFGIIGGRSTGVVVKTILPGGVADRDGRLQSGDHILQIGEVNLRGLGSEQVASVLRQCGVHVRMVVARPIESANADFQTLSSLAPIVPTKILGDPVELDRHLIENGYGGVFSFHSSPSAFTMDPYIYTGHPDIQFQSIVNTLSLPVPFITQTADIQDSRPEMHSLDQHANETDLPETESFVVKLTKDDLGLGITVAGYVCEKEEISGIFVKSISKGSAADLTHIQINDRIVQVNDISVLGYTNHRAVETLRNAGSHVTLKLERYLRGPKYEQLQQAIRANELRPASPASPTLSSLPKVSLSHMRMDYLDIEPDEDSRTSFEFDSAILLEAITPSANEEKEIVIGGERKCLQVSVESYEQIYARWRERLDANVEVLIAQLPKDVGIGLGISLEGTVDVEDGKEVRPHHYIRNILPDGPVGRDGTLQAGDELLEVNGVQLLGLNHLEVVSILKQLPNFVSITCARRPTPIRIIDTSQHREAFQTRKIFAGSFQTIIPVNETNCLVKAKSESSIASSMASDAISRSRSLELPAPGLPMWCEEPTVVELVKGDHGLGFSILDYQDPFEPQATVIVIRSLVPGGVAQNDGRLIPGDRLLAVNDVDVGRSTLDRAVQALKGAQKGIVKITVAKPITGVDAVSQNSQDTEEDHTCLEDFQECIEEFQECLDDIHICMDDDNYFFNHSPCSSEFENFGQKLTDAETNCTNSDHVVKNRFTVHKEARNSNGDSDVDISFKSLSEVQAEQLKKCSEMQRRFTKNDSVTQSDKPTDGYETCFEESWSEDNKSVNTIRFQETDPSIKNSNPKVQNNIRIESTLDVEEATPTNSKVDLLSQFFRDTKLEFISDKSVNSAVSEPCLQQKDIFCNYRHIYLDNKSDDGLKSYDNHHGEHGDDEFFLVEYFSEPNNDVIKSVSEPNVLEGHESARPKMYRKCLKEYYNDYADCLEAYNPNKEHVREELDKKAGKEVGDDEVFSEIYLPFKCRSAPDIMDSSFVTLTYDPGPDMNRRKSAFVPGYHRPSSSEMTVLQPPESNAEECYVEEMLQKHWGSSHAVKVYREPNKSLGINIVGGKVDLLSPENSSDTVLGIFVKNVVPNSPAEKTGKFKTGDRILEVSGIDLREANHEKAVQAIRNATNPVTFVIQSLIPFGKTAGHDSNKPNNVILRPSTKISTNKKEEEESEKDTNETKVLSYKKADVIINKPSEGANLSPVVMQVVPVHSPQKNAEHLSSKDSLSDDDEIKPVKKTVLSDSEEGSEDDEDDARELEGRTVSAKGQSIDRASAANVKRSKDEIAADNEEEDDFGYTTHKVKKKYAPLGHRILMVQLERSNSGLGLSLAGHKDRSCMAVFVCGLNPTGAAYKSGNIQIGDEILEVNGVVLHGRCHLNASAIIKGLSGPTFKVIILRRKTAIDDIAVKPITQFPVSLAEEASEEQFSSSYPNVRTVAVKKQANQSLGIMIIEGKHAEVGQGIFISDIQEGSSAEKAGLEIGEMILAVNKDSLVGSNYDMAAGLLKRTEGLVTLVVSNPGKKERSSSPAASPALSADNTAVENNRNAVANTLKPSAPPSRSTTPVPEPVADPAVCPIVPGRDVTIEIPTENKGIGIFFVGGKDTQIPNGIVIVEIYPGGTADKDKRLQPGDQLLEINGTSLKDVSYTTALQALRQALPKMKIIVHRPSAIDFTTIEVDLIKKPGKGLGLSVLARKSGLGVYVADIISGSTADLDGRIIRGDLVISVNGQNVENVSGEEAGAILKTVMGKVSLKLHRYKPVAR